MGKTLIIKGADFSQVAVGPRKLRWAFGYSDSTLNLASSGKTFYQPSNPADVCFAFSSGADGPLKGHTVRKVRFYAVRTGTLCLMRLDREAFTVDCKQTLQVSSTGIVELELSVPIFVDSSHTVGVGYSSDAATKYLEGVGSGYSFDMVTLSTQNVGANNCTFVIDYAVS